jgi:hypothetical protein
MSWSKIDDLLPHHRKVRGLGCDAWAAFGLYVASICFAQREFTDGLILRTDLPALIPGRVPTPRHIQALVAAGLWDPLPDGGPIGWYIHDYLDWNDSAAVRRQKLQEDAARKRAGRSGRNPPGIHPDVRPESARRPDVAPSSSSPSSSEKSREAPTASADGLSTTGGTDGAQQARQLITDLAARKAVRHAP